LLGRRKNHAINEDIYILAAKIRQKVELPGHIVVLG
jgi:hypothetical protein